MRSSSETEYESRPPTSAKRALVRQPRASIERRLCSRQPSAPAVLARQGGGLDAISAPERRERAEPLALGRGRLEVAGERRERPSHRVTPDVVGVEELAHALPERARLPQCALVADRLADEDEAPAGARAHRREEEAVAARGVGSHEPSLAPVVQCVPCVVVEERLASWPAWERALLETERRRPCRSGAFGRA